LPDWSGAWVITGESAREAFADSGVSIGQPTGNNNQNRVPLKPQYQIQPRNLITESKAAASSNLVTCKPAGLPGVLQHPMMIEYLITPGRVTILFEDGEVRRIYTDGRAHPQPEEMEYGFLGHSIGKWEGPTLVVDTIGISPQSDLLVDSNVKVTRNTHIVERIFLKDPETLQIDTVLSDDELLTKPYTYMRTYKRSTLPMSEPGCSSRNRDNDNAVDLTPPPP
jgi:hypothetical protein